MSGLFCPYAWFETETEDGVKLILNNAGTLPSQKELRELLSRVRNTLSIPTQEVDRMNMEAVARRESKVKTSSWTGIKQQKQVYLYLARNSRNGLTKIGISTEPKFREQTLMSQEPEVAFLFYREGSKTEENSLHRIFSDKRVRGEWFKLTEQDVSWVRAWCPEDFPEGYVQEVFPQ